MKSKLHPTQYQVETCSDADSMLNVLKLLTGKKSISIAEDGKVRFSGLVDIELDFNKEIENYYFSNVKIP